VALARKKCPGGDVEKNIIYSTQIQERLKGVITIAPDMAVAAFETMDIGKSGDLKSADRFQTPERQGKKRRHDVALPADYRIGRNEESQDYR
jgi:hypothetical protein